MKTKYYKLAIWLVFTLLSGTMLAQDFTITGKVTDGETGEGLPGVNVLEEGTMNGTITDLDGNYTITISGPERTLAFSFVGYVQEIVKVANRSVINVTLIPDLNELDEVVVIGYGVQKKKVVTGAISSMDSEELTSTPVLRVEQSLQGRMAGVQMINQSGQPGEEPTVRIRGTGTTGNANPLYIVDGMEVSGIDFLNSGDIESIDVLKDAASAAIYGARAANGVVLITTKKGTSGKMNVTYSGYEGIQNASNKIDLLNAEQYQMMMNEGLRNAGLEEEFDLNEIPEHNTNWVEELFVSNAPIRNHELLVNGGTERSQYMSSLSYFTQQGIIGGEKSQFDRITARLNTTHKVLDNFSFGNNLSYSHIIRRGVASNQSFNGPYSSALNLDPLTPVYETDPDELNQPPYSDEPVLTDGKGNVYGISEYVGAEIVNPLALIELENDETRVDKVIGNVYGDLELVEGLVFRTSLGIDLAYVLDDSYRPNFFLNDAQNNTGKTSVHKEIDRYFTWQIENSLNYTKEINGHNIGLLIGTTTRKENAEDLRGDMANVPITDPDHVYLDMATDTIVAGGGAYESSLRSFFGRITYDYNDKYSFTGILRGDGSSRFGSKNRYGLFPSVGVSWFLTDEDFIPEIAAVEYIKLRASYGINGNDKINNYRFLAIMDDTRDYLFAGGRALGASPKYIENAEIQWEQSRQLDIAMEFGFFKNKLSGVVDYYIKNTEKLLEIAPIPGHVGNDPPYANVGSIRNKGIELAVNWRQYTNGISYAIGLNGAYNINEVTHIENNEKVLIGASYAVAGTVTRAEEGYSLPYFYGYKSDGLFQTEAEVYQHIGKTGKVLQPNAVPGDVRFLDVNNDGELTEEDRTNLGSPIPKLSIGFNASVDYAGFDLSTIVIGSFGNKIFNGTQRQDLQFTNRTTEILERWTGPGTSDEIPRFTFSDVNNNYRISDLYLEDGSYLRVKNIQLGYSIPQNILARLGAEKWRIYISAENLITWTNYTGADPEIGSITDPNRGYQINPFDTGIDRGVYPQARTYRIGTSITF